NIWPTLRPSHMRLALPLALAVAIVQLGCPNPPPGCVPRACEGACGRLDDGCGGTRPCGDCPDGAVCAANRCGCTGEGDSAFCARLGSNCGPVTGRDNCNIARTVASCGSCTAPQSCTTGNVCGC